jgi:hypothetical protein
MKRSKTVSLILLIVAMVAAGYGIALVRRGFGTRETPSVIEKFAATTAREMAVPSNYRQLQNRFSAMPENYSGRHGTFC